MQKPFQLLRVEASAREHVELRQVVALETPEDIRGRGAVGAQDRVEAGPVHTLVERFDTEPYSDFSAK